MTDDRLLYFITCSELTKLGYCDLIYDPLDQDFITYEEYQENLKSNYYATE